MQYNNSGNFIATPCLPLGITFLNTQIPSISFIFQVTSSHTCINNSCNFIIMYLYWLWTGWKLEVEVRLEDSELNGSMECQNLLSFSFHCNSEDFFCFTCHRFSEYWEHCYGTGFFIGLLIIYY